MKKILIGLFVISSLGYAKEVMPTAEAVTIQAEELGYSIDVKVGGELYSNYTLVKDSKTSKKLLGDETDGIGYELSVELLKKRSPNFETGVGIAYQNNADRKNINSGIKGASYDSMPIYVTAKYKFNVDSLYVPYVKVNLGYSFNFNEKDLTNSLGKSSINIDDGLYWAIGGGVEYNNFLVELMYGVTKSDAKSPKVFKGDYAIDYEKVTLSVGYSFDL
ncbi:outer membrane beta-barrel protein [Fusobacterium sp. IOR10]|uniref:OmpW family outer membrane protein n=1 Tax=Fusobacterium sp. IOR10 TaxID=2665157 RepID=UPI0013D2EDA8|nr:outer membrane beta-barrel protein [Fusobacterium sp. IOR10]